jgi:hypothetical protein
MNEGGYDWFRFWVHFVFGALLGALACLFFWMNNWHPGLSPWLCVILYSLATALLGGLFGDRFWEWFLKNLRWL